MAEARAEGGMMDLEKELSCSICTDLLYQPLTLLDCLHTFCGACLQEWFSLQASTATTTYPYTCPSCRASVRETKPNATVTTLLDMFLQGNPAKGKSAEEKEDMRKKYKPGDNVLPAVLRREDPGDEQDRRLLEEIRQLSLQEVGVSSTSLAEPRRRLTERSRERREREIRARQGGDPSGGRNGRTFLTYQPTEDARSRSASRRAQDTSRQLEHQSSLRSILSAAEVDSQEMREDILRQIVEEGLLDGIDFNNLDVSQEDEISERIVQAYRRRQREREQQRDRARQSREGRRSGVNHSQDRLRQPSSDRDRSRRRQQATTDGPTGQSQPSRPPVSRPHLFGVANDERRQHRRSSSQGSAPSVPRVHGSERASLDQVRPSSSEHRAHLSSEHRRSTDPEWPRSLAHARSPDSGPSSPRLNTSQHDPSSAVPGGLRGSHDNATSRDRNNLPYSSRSVAANNSSPSLGAAHPNREAVVSSAHPSSSSGASSITSLSCDRCGKTRIESDVHYNCPKCKHGSFNLCLRCYRLGRGCERWYGFGHAAWARYRRRAPPEGYPPGHEPPHFLTGRQYQRVSERHAQSPGTTQERRRTLAGSSAEIQVLVGVFCDICLAFANSCFWKCEVCNDGAWGFCNGCVNQGRHCTHPLLPVAEKVDEARGDSSPSTSTLPPSSAAPHAPPSASPLPMTIQLANRAFTPLTFSASCDICRYPIPPSNTRYHCQSCNGGDYDICSSCYNSLVSNGTISPENGPQGWRRCLRGHRMSVIGFEDRDGGQRRVVTREPVGGLALKEENDATTMAASGTLNWSWRDVDGTRRHARATSAASPTAAGTRLPPDGGVGLRVLALWSYYPTKGVTDELMFPKNAEIREAEDINGDWFWGRYAGAKGLFPGNYGRVI